MTSSSTAAQQSPLKKKTSFNQSFTKGSSSGGVPNASSSYTNTSSSFFNHASGLTGSFNNLQGGSKYATYYNGTFYNNGGGGGKDSIGLVNLDYSTLWTGLVVEICKFIVHICFIPLSIWPIRGIVHWSCQSIDAISTLIGYGVNSARLVASTGMGEISLWWTSLIRLCRGTVQLVIRVPWQLFWLIGQTISFGVLLAFPIVLKARYAYSSLRERKKKSFASSSISSNVKENVVVDDELIDNQVFIESDIPYFSYNSSGNLADSPVIAQFPIASSSSSGSGTLLLDVYYSRTTTKESATTKEATKDQSPSSSSNNKPSPVIIFFQGGSWNVCKKELYVNIGKSLASLGYVCVIPNFSVFPTSNFKAMVRDVLNILQWTRLNISTGEFRGDPNDLYLVGHSSGFHLVMVTVLDGSNLFPLSEKDRLELLKSISHMVGISGIYDLCELANSLDQEVKGSFLRLGKMFSKDYVFPAGGIINGTMLMDDSDDLPGASINPASASNVQQQNSNNKSFSNGFNVTAAALTAYSPIHMLESIGSRGNSAAGGGGSNLLRSNLPSITLIHGTGDKTSPFSKAETISLMLAKYGTGSGTLLAYDNYSHLEPILQWLDAQLIYKNKASSSPAPTPSPTSNNEGAEETASPIAPDSSPSSYITFLENNSQIRLMIDLVKIFAHPVLDINANGTSTSANNTPISPGLRRRLVGSFGGGAGQFSPGIESGGFFGNSSNASAGGTSSYLWSVKQFFLRHFCPL